MFRSFAALLVRQCFALTKSSSLLQSKNSFMTAIDKIIQRLETMSNGQRLLGEYLLSDSSGLRHDRLVPRLSRI
jgi:hypothetical protein